MMGTFLQSLWKQIQKWLNIQTEKESQPLPISEWKQLLCVDDDVDFCRYMQKIAHSQSIKLDAAYSLAEAKDKIEKKFYDAYVIDGHLLDGSGFDLVAWMRQEKGISAPIGFLSRIYQDATSFRLLKEQLQVEYVLEKPIEPDEAKKLFRRLRNPQASAEELPTLEEDFLADIKKEYHKSIYDKLARLEKLIVTVQRKPSIETMKELKIEVHKIAGSSGSYGFPKVSELCKKCEVELDEKIKQASIPPSPTWLSSLDDFFHQVKTHFQISSQGNGLEEKETKASSPEFYILIVTQDTFFLSDFQQDRVFHFKVKIEQDLEKAKELSRHISTLPSLILIDETLGKEAILNLLAEWGALVPIALLFYQKSILTDDLEEAKIRYFIEKPADSQQLFSILTEVIQSHFQQAYKMLIVDDDPDIGHYIVQALKEFDINILVQLDGSQLNQTLESFYPHCLLLDIQLSGYDGLRLLKELKSNPRYQHLKVFVITSYTLDELVRMGYQSEADGILIKPLKKDTLQQQILRVLGSALAKPIPVTLKHHGEIVLIDFFDSPSKEWQKQSQHYFPHLRYLTTEEMKKGGWHPVTEDSFTCPILIASVSLSRLKEHLRFFETIERGCQGSLPLILVQNKTAEDLQAMVASYLQQPYSFALLLLKD